MEVLIDDGFKSSRVQPGEKVEVEWEISGW